jgi:hypothetical protein
VAGAKTRDFGPTPRHHELAHRPAVDPAAVPAGPQARGYKHEVQAKQIGVFADCKTIGATFGVGLGLYFRIMGW